MKYNIAKQTRLSTPNLSVQTVIQYRSHPHSACTYPNETIDPTTTLEIMKKIFPLFVASILTLSSLAAKESPPKGFKSLFDGQSLKGWSFIPSEIEPIWKVDSKKIGRASCRERV